MEACYRVYSQVRHHVCNGIVDLVCRLIAGRAVQAFPQLGLSQAEHGRAWR